MSDTPAPRVLRPYQLEATQRVEDSWANGKSRVSVVLPTGTGKYVPHFVPVPTPYGVKLHGDLRVGDVVFHQSGNPTTITHIHPQGLSDVWRITFSDKTSMLAGKDHLWKVWRRKRKPKLMTTWELANTPLVDEHDNGMYMWRIPMTDPVKYPERNLPVEPYTMGALIANGHTVPKTPSGIMLTTPDEEVYDRVRSRYPDIIVRKYNKHVPYASFTHHPEIRDGIHPLHDDGNQRLIFTHHPEIRDGIHELGLNVHSGKKFIPTVYLESSVEQRIALLQGLMDGDGSSRSGNRRSVNYHTTSPRLAEDVQKLVWSLGGTAMLSVQDRPARKDRKECTEYTLSILMPSSIYPWHSSRKVRTEAPRKVFEPHRSIVSVEYAGKEECQCITVDNPDGLYLVGNEHIVTHNSSVIANVATRARRTGKKALLLAHRTELLDQMAGAVQAVDPLGEEVGIVAAERDEHQADIVAASFQTLSRSPNRLAALGNRDVILADECHHISAATYTKVLEDMGALDPSSGVNSCGFTATMYRDDGKALGDVWSEVVFEKDLMWAIREGYLIAPHGKTIAIQGLNQLASIRSVRGDYNQTELADVMNASVDSTVDAILRHCPDAAMIVFAAGVKHAATLAGKLTAAGIPARDVTGAHKRDYREEAYSDFREGRINCLVTVQVLTEGADFPRCDTVVLARPTRSKVLLCFDSATEILTSRGWVNGMELENDDQVAQWSGTTEEISFTAPLHYFSRAVEDGERMVSLNLPATSIRVTEDHRVYFRPKGAPEHAGWRVSPASELADKSKRQVLIPSAGMSKFNGIPLTDDEIRLIAWVTTDGGIRKDNLAYVSQSKASNVPEIERIIQACGIKYGTHVDSKPTNFGARSHPLVRYSMSLGKPRGRDSHLRGWGYLEKWMFKTNPRFKTEGSSEVQSRWEDVSSDQWDVFMNTLDAANGANTTVDNLGWTPRSLHVSLSSLPFAEWVQAMCVQRGWSTSLTQHTGRTGLWMLHAKKITRRVIGGSDGRPTWTYEDPDPYEKVWCVTVPSGAVVTRRKGKVTILGQCQIIGRAVRPYTDPDGFEKDTALVLDLTGVVRDAKLTSLTDLYPEAKREVYTEDGEEVTGTDKDPTLAPPEKERKGILQLEDIDLVEGGAPFRSKVLWMKSDPLNTDGDEIAFMPLRYPRQYVFLYPPLNRVTDKGVMLGRLDANRGITFVTDPTGNIVRGNIAEAMTAAEQIVGSTGYIRKDAQWRKPSVKPSDSQKSLAKNLNIDVDPNMLNKAELSDLITLRLAKPLLADVVRRTGYPLE